MLASTRRPGTALADVLGSTGAAEPEPAAVRVAAPPAVVGLEAANRSTFVGTPAPGPVAAGVPAVAVVVTPAVPAVAVVVAPAVPALVAVPRSLPAAADRSTIRSMMARAKRWQWPPVRAVTRSSSTTTSWSV